MIDAPSPMMSEQGKDKGVKAKYKGVAKMTVIVGEDGAVRDAKVTKSLGADLDNEAIKEVKRWRFEPATKNGKPVAVQIAVDVNFSLH
jgi:TonB family protein